MRLILFLLTVLIFSYCGTKNEKKSQSIKKTVFVSDSISRDKVRGVWLRKEYIDKLKKDKNPSEAYLEYKDFIALRFFKYDMIFSLSLCGGEIDSSILEKVDAEYALEYKNNKSIYIEILDLHHSIEYPIEAQLYDSLTQFGYVLSLKDNVCDNRLKDSLIHYSEFVNNGGFKCLEIKKDSNHIQEKYFLKFENEQLTFSIHSDTVIEYTFVQVNRNLRMGNLGYAYQTIPNELYNFTVMGKYHLYTTNNELIEENIILSENGKVKYWNEYKSYSLGLVHENGLKNLMYLQPNEPREGEYSHKYLMEKEGDIIKLYFATAGYFERLVQHKKGELAFELRPSPKKNINIIPI